MIEEKQASKLEEGLSFLKDIVIIVITVLVLQRFIIIPFMINGQSMASSYYDREFIIVDRISYILGEPDRGDVIVFEPGVDDDKEFFLKRIIGMPGDTLKIENGKVFLKEKGEEEFVELQESYLNTDNREKTFVGIKGSKTFTLGDGDYFVMGDNRNHSTDSRECFGDCSARDEFVAKDEIIGKVFIDFGYFDFRKLKFLHPVLGVDTSPRFFSSPATHEYTELQ